MLILLAAASLARAEPAGVEAGFQASLQVVADTAWDRPPEDRLESWLRLQGDASGPAGDRGRWWLGVLGEQRVMVGAPAEGGDLEAAWEVRPWESGWEGPVGPAFLKAGYLVERWGALDLLPVNDVLMGRDLSAGPLTPLELVRLPAPLARLQLGQDRARAELVVLPFGARDRIALEGTDWALLRQGQVEGLLRQSAGWEGDALTTGLQQQALSGLADGVDQMDQGLRRGLSTALLESGRPRPLDEAVDLGLRLEAEPAGWDLALSGAWMRSRQPMPTLDPALAERIRSQSLLEYAELETILDRVSPPVAARWPRTWTAGAELGRVLGPFGLRAEARYQSVKVVPRQWLQAGRSPSLAAGLGLDRAWGTRLALLAELRWERLLEPPPDPLLLRQDSLHLALAARLDLLDERLRIEPGLIHDLGFNELLGQLELVYRASDSVELSLGGLLLQGATPPPRSFQQALTHRGGPFSAWGDNDSVFAGLTWIR